MATCTIAITFAHGYGLVAAHGCGACLAYFNNKLEAGMPDDFGDDDDEDEVRGRPAGRGAGGGRGGGGRGGRGGRGGGKKKGRGKMSEAIQEEIYGSNGTHRDASRTLTHAQPRTSLTPLHLPLLQTSPR